MQKVDILIKGNLICDSEIRGGYVSSGNEDNLPAKCTITGDVYIKGSVDFGTLNVAVTNHVIGGR